MVSGLLEKITELNDRMRQHDLDLHTKSAFALPPWPMTPMAVQHEEIHGRFDSRDESTAQHPAPRGTSCDETQAGSSASKFLPDFHGPADWPSLALNPVVDAQVRKHLRELHGAWPPSDPDTATRFLIDYLGQRWRQAQFEGSHAPHREIFVGPPASGKTTFLGKWLARTVLVEDRSVTVWRLNGRTANTAEGLSVLCQGLNVPVERSWSDDGRPAATPQFIDLPGADWRDAAALDELKVLLQTISHARVHLVLNAAYDIEVLLRQADRFRDLPLASLILTHLDEQPNRWKLWNLVLGTNLSISFLGAGQNVPGNLTAARAEMLLPCA